MARAAYRSGGINSGLALATSVGDDLTVREEHGELVATATLYANPELRGEKRSATDAEICNVFKCWFTEELFSQGVPAKVDITLAS